MKLKPKTKAQWRVAIMRDVIKQLDLRTIIALSGTYVSVDASNRYDALNQAKLLGENAPECRVCMLGATFLSAVRLDNKYDKLFIDTRDYHMHERLSSYFTEGQRNVIEAVFEGFYEDSVKVNTGLSAFYLLSDETRLRFIASFVIKGKGSFGGTSPYFKAKGGATIEKAAAAFGRSEARKKSKAVKALA